MKKSLLLALALSLAVFIPGATSQPTIPRRVPPTGIDIPLELRSKWENRLLQAHKAPERIRSHPEIEIFRKAIRFAIINGEFYDKKQFALAEKLLDEGDWRANSLSQGKTPWTQAKGLVVRGFRSTIDDSVQPYGLEIPEKLELNRPVPLYVWLHGRGDKNTDLHFIGQRMTRTGNFSIDDGIVLHPFGRQCIGYKSAGETDVLEAIEAVKRAYRIDEARIALMGFSMGGAGAWHLGARYANKWTVVHAGAGFAETARYNRLTKDKYPPWYEQRLWGLHDAPGYVRNLFNFPVIAYSGEIDKQKQAADVMAEAFATEGKELPHLIGPKMGHKYDAASKEKILAFVQDALAVGRNRYPVEVNLQTRTLRHNRMCWIYLSGLVEHWKDSRVDAIFDSQIGGITAKTKNASSLIITNPYVSCCSKLHGFDLRIDDSIVKIPPAKLSISLIRSADGTWKMGSPAPGLRKKHGLQGPIDDAFLSRFLVVAPDGSSGSRLVDQWVTFEIAHLEKRWRELFRGDLPLKKASEVTEADRSSRHLVLWGTPKSNKLIAEIADKLPVTWKGDRVVAGKRSLPSSQHVPVLIYPNPLFPNKYVVLNSGPTFREAHDRTNSLQNPKLPDWAILDLSQAPDAEAAGKVVAADFFDERWNLKPARPN
ncbi:MAG: prolyl oligopeptidase family serine peptidase [Opitutales bacterium]